VPMLRRQAQVFARWRVLQVRPARCVWVCVWVGVGVGVGVGGCVVHECCCRSDDMLTSLSLRKASPAMYGMCLSCMCMPKASARAKCVYAQVMCLCVHMRMSICHVHAHVTG
jgi:hypothetical protein